MDTNKLNHFRVVAETGNLRRAAELLHLSHAGLSKSVHSLEDELGVRLITKDGRNLRITREGRRLLQDVVKFLDAERKFLDSVKGREAVSVSRLRLGTFEIFSTYVLPRILAACPGETQFEVQELIPGQIEQAIESDRIDVGITYVPIPNPNVDHLEVFKVQMGVYVSARPRFSERALGEMPFVVPIAPLEGSPTRVRGLDGWPEDEIRRQVRYRVTLMESAMSLVRQGVAAAYLPRFVVQEHNAVVKEEFRLKEVPSGALAKKSQSVFLVKSKSDAEDQRMKALARALRGLRV